MSEIIGVGLLLFLKGKLLVIRELRSKPQYSKYAGMLSFPLETFEKSDITFRKTLSRLAQEELGIINGEIILRNILPDKFNLLPGKPDIATYYGVADFAGSSEHIFVPQDDDIEVIGWMNPDELLQQKNIRVEVRPILEHFFSQGNN
jgi:hypothetical protein